MTLGKNKRISKGKKGGKKKTIDPLTKKEWYNFKSPAPFEVKSFGKTCITRTQGTKISTERIKGRVVEVSLADLKNNADQLAWRKVRLIVEDVEGKYVRTSFHGLGMTRDKLCTFIKKWQQIIEAFCEVKTKDGYILRVFCIAFTKNQREEEGQQKKTCYAQNSQVKKIRKIMVDNIQKEAATRNITQFVQSLISEGIVENIAKDTKFIFPLQHIVIKKVKMLKKPKTDIRALNELFVDGPKENAETKKGEKGELPREGEEADAVNLLKK